MDITQIFGVLQNEIKWNDEWLLGKRPSTRHTFFFNSRRLSYILMKLHTKQPENKE
jgi:hypothetical protein